MITRKRAVGAIAVALAMITASACGSDDDDATSTSPTTDDTTDAAAETTTPEAPSTTQVTDMPALEGGSADRATSWDNDASFSFVYSVDTTGWTPNTIQASHSQIYLYPIYDTLIFLDEDANPGPLLATSWDLVEENVIELSLREDWAFHDGAPFNADAVKANIDYARTLDGGFNQAQLELVESVDVIDEFTVQITTSGSAAPLVGILGGTSGMMMSPELLDDEDERVTPTGGSGAYELVDYVSGSRVDYKRVDNYWDPDMARVEDLTFFISNDDNARLNFVITGEADATFLRASMLEAAENATPTLDVKRRPSMSAYVINLNADVHPELADERVRRALSMGIDREGIGDGLLNGLLTPSHTMFPEWHWAGPNADNIGEDYIPYDPDGARELLAEAGASDFSFSIHAVAQGVWPQIAEVLQANWTQLGLDVEVVTEEVGALVSNFRVEQTIGVYLQEVKGDPDPSVTVANIYLANGGFNPSGVELPEVRELHVAALQGSSPEDRSPIYSEMMEVLAADVSRPLVIGHITTPFASNTSVQDMPVPADGSRWFRWVSIAES